MTGLLSSTTLVLRTDPLEAPRPQTVASGSEVFAFLHHFEALADTETAWQLVETPSQVACVVADAPVDPVGPVTQALSHD